MIEKTLKAIDLDIPLDGTDVSDGIAYYRISPEFRDFISLCEEKHGVIGFEYTMGEMNLGIILAKKMSKNMESKQAVNEPENIEKKINDPIVPGNKIAENEPIVPTNTPTEVEKEPESDDKKDE